MSAVERSGQSRPPAVSLANSGLDVTRRLRLFARLHVTDGAVLAGGIFVILLLVHSLYVPIFSAFQLSILANGTAALAFAALGQLLVVLTGGFDLSPAAIVAVVNVIVATKMVGDPAHDAPMLLLAIAVGVLAGLFNGFCVAFLKLQSIIVTIATLFIFSGVALFITPQPAGLVPDGIANFLTGSIADWLPNSLIFIVLIALFWLAFERTYFGKAIVAIGSDRAAAFASGVPVKYVLLGAYGLAGLFYALSGLFLSAQTYTGDPSVSTTFLLSTFLAVVLGGARFGGGHGSGIGAILGAFIVTLLVSVLFDLGVNSLYTGVVDGLVIALAVVLTTLVRRMRLKRPQIAPATKEDV
jgi:ribose transport system permease protein